MSTVRLQDLQKLSDNQREKLRRIRSYASREMLAHGLGDYVFEWSDDTVKMGEALYAPDFEAGILTLSAPYCLCNPIAVAMDTIWHEVAHLVVGPSHGHDEVWMAKVRELGCRDLSACAVGVVSPGPA